jgi:hypothetical protein
MATKPPDFTSVIGSDAMQTYLNAQKRANEAFEERNNRLFDPIALAAAQGFLAPTKTGSFGESLGNVAASLGPAQSAEEKRTMEMAKMRLDMATQGLSTEIQQKQAEMKQRLINEDLGPDSPYAKPPVAPQVAPQPAPPAAPVGALPSVGQPPAVTAPPAQAPAQAPLSMAQTFPVRDAMPPQAPAPQAPVQAPMAQQGPVGTQLFPAQPEGLTAQEKLEYKRGLANNKDPYEIRKDIMETRRKNIQVNQAGTSGVNLVTGQKFGFDPTPTDTYIYGYGSYKIPATYATMLGEAQQDPDKYAELAKMIVFGPQAKTAQPSAPNATPTGAAPAGAPAQRPTTAQSEATAAALKVESEEDAKSAAARTTAAKNLFAPAIETRIVAQSAKDLVNQEGGKLVMGIFEKPTVSAALAKMIDEGKFTPVGFRDAMVAANVAFSVPQKPNENNEQYTDRKQQILDRYYQTATQVARAKFEASKLAQGQGAFSDGERRLFADTTLSMKDSVSTINKKADMLIERANFAQDLSREMSRARMNYDTFVDTPQGQKMIKDYEKRLSSIWTGKPVSSSKAPTSSKSSSRPDLNAAREAVEKELR